MKVKILFMTIISQQSIDIKRILTDLHYHVDIFTDEMFLEGKLPQSMKQTDHVIIQNEFLDSVETSLILSFLAGYTLAHHKEIFFYDEQKTSHFFKKYYLCFQNTDQLQSHFIKNQSHWQKEKLKSIAQQKLFSPQFLDKSFLYFIEMGDEESVHLLLKLGVDPNTADDYGDRAINKVIRHRYVYLVKLLLAYQADPLFTGSNGNNALLEAVASNHNDIIEILLEVPYEINSKNQQNQTAIMLAIANKNELLIKKLMLLKPELDVKDNLGLSAYDYAQMFQLSHLLIIEQKEEEITSDT